MGRSSSKRIALLLTVLTSCPTTTAADADAASDSGYTRRQTALLAAPESGADVVAELAVDTPVNVYERQRLWLRIKDPSSNEGWLRLTDVRLSATVESGGFASSLSALSRSVTGFMAGFRRSSDPSQTNYATLGVRGLTVSELQAAAPDFAALERSQAVQASPSAAQQFATAGGLAARDVEAADD